MNRGLTSILASEESRKQEFRARSAANSKGKDKRRAVLHARIFVVLRPPQHLAEPTLKLARLTAKHRREMQNGFRRPGGNPFDNNNNNNDDENAPKPSDEEYIVRDFEADDEADEVWDPHALLVLPLTIPIAMATATVSDVMQAAWPYVVESYRDQGRFWHDESVPEPLPEASPWFSLRMVSRQWRDPAKAEQRACLEPPVASMLAGYETPDFAALALSLHRCSFEERALIPETLVKKVLPEDLRAKAAAAAGSGAAAALLSASMMGAKSSYFTGRASGNAKKNANANATHYRANFLLTLSTQYLLQEHITLCEARTRESVFSTITSFLHQMKSVEAKSLECAVARTEQRERVDKMFGDLVSMESRRRVRIEEGERAIFRVQLSAPYEETQERILPVLRESHRILMGWRSRLEADVQRERENVIIEQWQASQGRDHGDDDDDDGDNVLPSGVEID